MADMIANRVDRLRRSYARRNRDKYARAEAKALIRVIRLLR